MEMAVEANDRHGARVKLELEAAPLAADATPTLAVNTEAADNTSGDECTRETDVKTLKLRLFQELQRSRRRDAWQTYWRALQQYVIAKLSVDELHCVVQTLLTPEAVELHNRFIVAILDQSQANSKSLGSDSHGSKRPPSEDEKSIEMDASGNTAAKETAVKTEEPSEKATRPKEAKSAVVHHTDRESGKKNGKRRFPSISSPEVSDENDIDTSVKKLLHFANSNRASASREDTDEQSAELLIGLGQFSSKYRDRAPSAYHVRARGMNLPLSVSFLIQRRLGFFDLLQHVLLVRGGAEHDAEHGDEGDVDAKEDPERRGRVVGLDHGVDAEREEDAREHVHADEAERDDQQVERRVAAAEHLVAGLRRRLLVRLDADDVHVAGRDRVLCFRRHLLPVLDRFLSSKARSLPPLDASLCCARVESARQLPQQKTSSKPPNEKKASS